MISINHNLCEHISEELPFNEGEFQGIVNFKNFPLEKARGFLNKACWSVVERMYDSIIDKKASQVVDIKYGNVSLGGRSFWHLDSSLNPNDYYYENYLFVTGEHNTTEFINGEIQLTEENLLDTTKLNIEMDKIDDRRYSLESNRIFRFWGDSIHRKPICKMTEPRLLIRLMNSDRVGFPSYFIK